MSSGQIFDYIPESKPPVSETIAAGLLRQVEQEALRRAGEHIDGCRAFWNSIAAILQQIAERNTWSVASSKFSLLCSGY